MFGSLKETWNRNHGNLLFGIALAMSLVGCSLRYFDLLPDIELSPPQVLGNEVPTPQIQPVMLVATIIAPKEMPAEIVEGYLEMHVPSGTLQQPAERLTIHPFEIQAGGMTSVVVDHLPQGQYTPLIYLDYNGNGVLDFDEKKKPVEPIRTPPSSSEAPTDSSMNANSIQLDSGRPKYIYLQF